MKDPLHEQLSAARRHQILDAAARVFAEKGYHPATIRDVAKAAGIADGTIYNYYANKGALLVAILERLREAALQGMELPALETLDLRGFLRAYLAAPLMALHADHAILFRVVISESLVNPALREEYQRTILQPTLALAEAALGVWAAQGALNPAHIPLALRVFSGLVLGLLIQDALGDPILAEHWDALPGFLADLLIDGLKSDR